MPDTIAIDHKELNNAILANPSLRLRKIGALSLSHVSLDLREVLPLSGVLFSRIAE